MFSISLKYATKSDLDTLVAIERSVSGTKLYHAITDPVELAKEFENNVICLIRCNADLVGYVMYRTKQPQTVRISGLAIMPPFQNRGIGRATVALLIKKLGVGTRFEVITHPENTRAVKLYHSQRFEMESRHENYFGDGEERVLFVKSS